MDDIVDRLNARDPFINDAVSLQPRLRNPDGPEAAAEITRLRAEVAEARVDGARMGIEAAADLAKTTRTQDDHGKHCCCVTCTLNETEGDIRALSPEEVARKESTD